MHRRQVFLYLHTHWDREWYRTFEGYRFRLSEVVLELMQILEADPEQVFLLDGQTAVVEDFLALHPEQSQRLKNLISEGRLQIGPWYILPDEFLVSGEALIRNLLLGTRQARAWGQAHGLGYLPDMFGHLAQMPQLLARCGLSPAILWRGVAPEQNFFHWRGLDHTPLPTLHLTKGYYMDAFHAPVFQPETLLKLLHEIAAATPSELPLLLPVGGDHLGFPRDLKARLQAFQAFQNTFELVLSTPEQLIKILPPLPACEYAGELRDCRSAYILPGVLSTRRYLKEANDRLQHQLETQIEPLLLRQTLSHGSSATQQAALAQAWKYLLQNQPHDSICGCSLDEVHQDMLPRFRWVETLAHELQARALNDLLSVQQQAHINPFLHLIQTGLRGYHDVATVELEFPQAEDVTTFRLEDQEGQAIPYEILSCEKTEKFVAEPDILPHWQAITRYRCLLPVDLTPAGQNRVLRIVPHEDRPPLPVTRTSEAEQTLENAWCRVSLDPVTGKLQFYRQEQHTWIRTLEGHVFVDEGDAGDSYNFSPPRHNSRVVLAVQEYQTEKTALYQKMRISWHGFLPAQLHESRESRSGVTVPCRVTTEITLSPLTDTLRFQTTVYNQARDHRLRLFFQSQPGARRCWSSTAFGYLERQPQPALPMDVPAGQERPADTFPFSDWIQVSAPDDQGFVLRAEGLHEAALTEWEGRPALALTLLRCVGWLSRDDLRTRGGGAGPRMKTPEAQCLGEHTFTYQLSLCGNDRLQALRRVEQWQHPPLLAQGTRDTPLPTLFALESEGFALSSLKQAEDSDAVILRLFNQRDHSAELTLKSPLRWRDPCLSDPLEQTEMRTGFKLTQTPDSTEIRKICAPFEIVTFKFFPPKSEE